MYFFFTFFFLSVTRSFGLLLGGLSCDRGSRETEDDRILSGKRGPMELRDNCVCARVRECERQRVRACEE